ncbi:MAG: glycoside hydrolase family 43 protein [Clostridia bacterium]|nr:glycoside hydrolase family 43 protein [Clostridia bacterium]
MEYAKKAESLYGKYLFVYFVGNGEGEERIHFAVSEDGYNFTPLNNNEAVITQHKGKKCVRDPYILKGQDGFYYIVGTDMKCEEGWESNHALVTWKSKNLIEWTDETIIDIKDIGEKYKNTTRAWAPQALWHEEKQTYMLYWAHSTKEHNTAGMYYAFTDDFKTITEPQKMYCRDIHTIDGDIIYNKKNGKYYLYFKHDEDQTIAYVLSDKPEGPYEDKPVVVSVAPSGVEGSEMYNINGTDIWVMVMDEYGKGRFFMQQTEDFETYLPVNKEDYFMDFGPRHGSICSISDEEYEALVKHFGKQEI